MKIKNNAYIYSPSDLSNHISCRHLTELNKLAAKGELKVPQQFNRVLTLLAERGESFESEYLQEFRSEGKSIVEISREDSSAHSATIAAMKAGSDIVYQARLSKENEWGGWADFLIKRNGVSSKLGNWSYEVLDTKLATETRAGTILQIALYSEAVGEIQGKMPEYMWVKNPDDIIQYRVDEYIAYVRLIKKRLKEALENEVETYPEPVTHCDICKWWKLCNEKRRADDHLTFIASIGTSQINEVRKHGVNTLEAMANLPLPIPFEPERGSIQTFEKIREQARVQWQSRNEGNRPIYETLEVIPEKGMNRLPEPTKYDIYLDLEGDPMVESGGLEYLIGYYFKGKYYPLWAKNEESEKDIFEKFIDLATEVKKKHPKMHIYHYAPYEVIAFKRLMGKYATKENEIDNFLRSGTFVDLYGVVRQSIRASVERYSIKDLEKFFGYKREMDLRELSAFKADYEFLLESKRIELATEEMKSAIQLYNQDDCISTHMLHQWLEKIRSELIAKGNTLTRPLLKEGDASENITAHQERIKPVFDALLAGVPVIAAERTKEQQAHFILAHMLDWYRREKKSFWWEYFRLLELPEDELLDERKAITYLEFTGQKEPINRSELHFYKFPPQECDIKEGYLKSSSGKSIGSVHHIDILNGTIIIKKGPSVINEPHPTSVFQMEDIDTTVKENAVIELAKWVAKNGIDNTSKKYLAARDLLLNKQPGKSKKEKDNIEQTYKRALKLKCGVLPIQGPPGTGKSYTAGLVIIKLIKEKKKIGITALTHKVIINLLQNVHDTAIKAKVKIKIMQKVSKGSAENHPWEMIEDNNEVIGAIGNANVIAGTSFMWARPEFANSVDYLFVDEAGQLSLIDTLAVSGAAENLILLGDPQQLKQPQQGVHPEGTEVSALEHILGDNKTISEEQGVFLEKSYRMHPSICEFDSEMFYESKLHSVSGLEKQKINGKTRFAGSGLFLEEVDHTGNTSSSSEEVQRVAEIVKELTKGDVYWIDRDSKRRVLRKSDIKIITPYNAQVQLLSERIPDIAIGTVDKFQGQESPVIIYSVASSSPQDAPRGMDFLYSPNRFNVAVSRAQGIFIMVANPQIFEPECKSPYQIKLANPFCRFKELVSKT